MYADDAVLLCNSEIELQKKLDNMSVYCNKWKIDDNTDQ